MLIPVRTSRRRAFTLLEVVLAISIGVMLIGGLYTALSIQFQHARAAREVIEESAVVRSLLTKITNDFSPIQGPINPFLNQSGAYVNSSTTTSQTGPAQSSTTNNSSSSTTGGATTATPTPANANVINVAMTNVCVKGDGESVVFTVTRAPTEALAKLGSGDSETFPCDLRRISYKLDSQAGLLRQEDTDITNANNLEPASLPPDISPTKENVVCAEVKEMSILYYNGQQWVSEWDGSVATLVGGNSVNQAYTQQGPPALIQFTFTLKMPSSSKAGEGAEVKVTHTVAIAAANRQVPSITAPQAASPE